MRRSELGSSSFQVLEIGCARSRWLPYFAAEFGCVVTGLDYSEIGCQQARAILLQEGVEGSVICADLFHPPAGMIGKYDLVFSAGVVEHFQDTTACLSALGRFLQPGGSMVTFIPNLAGLVGWIQKRINRAVFDVHVPLTRRAFQKAHLDAGLLVRECRYFLPVSFGMMNLSGLDRSRPSYRWKWRLHNELHRLSKLAWWVEQRAGFLPGSRLLSPYILCVSETTAGTSRQR